MDALMVVLEKLDCSGRLMSSLFKHGNNWKTFFIKKYFSNDIWYTSLFCSKAIYLALKSSKNQYANHCSYDICNYLNMENFLTLHYSSSKLSFDPKLDAKLNLIISDAQLPSFCSFDNKEAIIFEIYCSQK